jgi:SulP family sulfate permease
MEVFAAPAAASPPAAPAAAGRKAAAVNKTKQSLLESMSLSYAGQKKRLDYTGIPRHDHPHCGERRSRWIIDRTLNARHKNKLAGFLPFLAWFPLRGETVAADAIAGITVALVAIPQSLAYAQLAGVPPWYGLYAAFIPTIVGALFGSSGVLSTGPVAMTSLLTFASVSLLAPRGSEQFIAYVVLLALLSGIFQVLFGVFRLGVLLNFLSHPVLMGFINAAAIIIALAQLPTLLGIPSRQSEHLLLDTWHVLVNIDTLHEISLAFGLSAIALLVAFRRFAPRLPGVLISVAALTPVSFFIGYAGMGGRVVGEIPVGLPAFSVPPLDPQAAAALLPAAFVIALISFMEAMSSCKVIAIRTRTAWDENQELIGQGLAKLAAAFCQSMPVSGSFSRSALNLASNAKTGMSSIIAALCVLLTLLFFTPLLYHLPKPVLAAIIIVAVSGLVDYGSIRRAWIARTDDGIAAVITFLSTLAFAPNIQNGILAGIIVSLTLLLYRLMRPRVAVLGLHEDGTLRDANVFKLPDLHPRIGAIRFDGPLYFVNVAYFEEAILRLAREKPRLEYLLISGSGITGIDASGVETLSVVVERLRASGITPVFSGLKLQVIEVMQNTGLHDKVGSENVFRTDDAALRRLRERLGADA